MASAWPAVVNKLVAIWTAAAQPGDGVFDGPPTGVDLVNRWVTVGHQEDSDQAASGTFQLSAEYDGQMWRETGSVHNEIIVISGDPGAATVRAAAFAFLDVLTSAVRADTTLGGVLGPGSTLDLVVEPIPVGDASTAEQRLLLSVNYSTIV